MVRETAVALGSLQADPANLVIACRRIVERHATVGPIWWLCATLLTADDPSNLAWELADRIEDDAVGATLARELPEAARLVTVGFPPVVAQGIVRRGDVSVWCVDSRFEASSFLQRLERSDIECEPVASESLAHITAAADLVLIEASAASSNRILAPVGSAVIAAVAQMTSTPVWLVTGTGRDLPHQYVDAIAALVLSDDDPMARDADEIAVTMIDQVIGVRGASSDTASALRSTTPFAPELLRPADR